MLNLKHSKIYKALKISFFTCVYFLLKSLKIGGRLLFLSKWVKDDGDNSLLIRYPLDSTSTVVDVGGYTGIFSDQIYKAYSPNLIILEPVKKYFNILREKYKKNPKIKVLNYGLSNKNSVVKIYISNDGTSLFKKSLNSEKIKLIDSSSFVKKTKIIDLMSINIEGSEYNVLDRLIKTGEIKNIGYIQIQFHKFISNSKILRNNILKELRKTHKLHYSYPFVWESFKRIK